MFNNYNYSISIDSLVQSNQTINIINILIIFAQTHIEKSNQTFAKLNFNPTLNLLFRLANNPKYSKGTKLLQIYATLC